MALEAEIDVSSAASSTPRAALHLLLLPIGNLLLLLASSRCGDLAST